MQNKFYESASFQETLSRYEQAMREGVSCYLDSDEFLDLSNYFIDKEQTHRAAKVLEQALSIHVDNVQLKVAYAGVMIYNMHFNKAKDLLKDVTVDDDIDVLYLQAQLACGMEHDYHRADSLFREWLELVKNEIADDEVPIDNVENEDDLIESPQADAQDHSFDPSSLRKFYLQVAVSFYELSDDEGDGYIYKWLNDYIDKFSPLGGYEEDVTIANMSNSLEFYDLAEKAYTMLLDDNPYFPKGWTILGNIQHVKGNIDEAIQLLEFALAVNPEDDLANLKMAECLYAKQNYDLALNYFSTYKLLSGRNDVDLSIGMCYFNKNDIEKAMLVFNDIYDCLMNETITDNNAHIFNELAEIYYHCKIYDKALMLLNLSEPFSQTSHYYILRGGIELSRGDTDTTLQFFDKALNLSEDSILTICEISSVLIYYDYACDAESMLKNVLPLIKQIPDHSSYDHVHALLGLALLKQHKVEESISHFRVACEKVPEVVKNMFDDYFPETLAPEDYYDYLLKIIQNTHYCQNDT